MCTDSSLASCDAVPQTQALVGLLPCHLQGTQGAHIQSFTQFHELHDIQQLVYIAFA